jgi:drug/metabolite transporter (DMT)-like permease
MTLLLGAMMIALRDSFGLPSLDLLLLLAGAGVFGTFISQMFYFEAHNLLPISVLNVYSLFQPVFVLIGSIIFLQAPVSTIKIIGAVCIVAGLLLVTRGQAHKNQARDQ